MSHCDLHLWGLTDVVKDIRLVVAEALERAIGWREHGQWS